MSLSLCSRILVGALALTVVFVLGVSTASGLLSVQPAFAASGYVNQAVGYDLSYPQCSLTSLPATTSNGAAPQFAIVGVNHGRPFTQNNCLVREYQMAAAQGLDVSFYMNLDAPHRGSEVNGQSGPRGTCSSSDLSCLYYNYGWNAAQYAYNVVRQTIVPSEASPGPSMWWLDVENGNWWSANTSLNDQVIQGAIDFFNRLTPSVPNASASGTSAPTAGIYSIFSMWRQIAGPNYRPGVPEWVATTMRLSAITRLSSVRSFAGGPVWLVQSASKTLDEDFVIGNVPGATPSGATSTTTSGSTNSSATGSSSVPALDATPTPYASDYLLF